MKIKQRRRRIVETEYRRQFQWKGSGPGFHGFTFLSDETGKVDVAGLNPAARQNYLDCVSGALQVHDLGVEEFENVYTEPGIGICNVCGEDVILAGFTCTCPKCETDYNSAGQQLAPRSQWGWETGETAEEILAVDHNDRCCCAVCN